MNRAPCRLLLLLPLALALPAAAQLENPVYVDDAPRAPEQVRRAVEQTRDNAGEAARILQELLDEDALRLAPRPGGQRVWTSVRRLALETLRADAGLLERWRTMQAPEARRLLEAGRLEELARTRPLTDSGLTALLRLAQRDLEAARFHAALARLEEARTHPDLDAETAPHAWMMTGVAAHYVTERDDDADAAALRDAARAALADPALDPRFAAALDERIASGAGPEVARGRTPLDRTATRDLGDLVGQTIWSVELGGAGPFGGTPGGGLGGLRRGTPLITESTRVAPTVADTVVFVNEGDAVHAFDRFTARRLWDRPYRDALGATADELMLAGAIDLGIVAVEGDALVTLIGGTGADRGTRAGLGRVVHLDARTGRPRWIRSLDRIGGDEEHAGLFPHGAPILFEGSVYLLARKLTNEKLMGCYLVALDLESGAPRWVRHLASSGSKTIEARPFSTLVRAGGDLYVASAVGVIARIDASSGEVRWLIAEPVPVNFTDRPHAPHEIGGAVVAGDRVVAISPDQRRIEVIDRETGARRGSFDAGDRARFRDPAYLLADDAHLFAIGSSIRAFAFDDPTWDAPIWSWPPDPALARSILAPGDAPSPSPPPASFPPTLDAELVGRVQLAEEGLVTPTDTGILILDRETGSVRHALPAASSGNPVAVGSQLIVAGNDSLNAFMSLSRAEEMIRQRIARSPEDPEPALSLLQLGLRVERFDLVLEAAHRALDAIRAAEAPPPGAADPRTELFAMVLEAHRRDLAGEIEEGEALHALLERVAATPEQRVEQLLARAEWLADLDPPRAAESYRAILADPLLASAPRAEAGVLRPADAWATRRLDALVRERGEAVLAEDRAIARAELGRLLAAPGGPDADALAALARRHPLTDSGLEASVRLAGLRSEAGDDRAARSALVEAWTLAPTPERTAALIGHVAESHERDGRPAAAAAVLEGAIARHGDLALATAAGPRRARRWRDALVAASPTPPAPRLGALGESVVRLRGRLVPRSLHAEGSLPADAFLAHDGRRLERRDARSLDVAWSAPLECDALEILAWSGDELLLWLPRGSGAAGPSDPRVVAFDPATGTERWSTRPIDLFVPAPLASGGGVRRAMPSGEFFEPDETIVRIDERAIVVIRRTGAVVAFDRADGRRALWMRDHALDEVHLAVLHPTGLVLAGHDRVASGGETGDPMPRIVLIDGEEGTVVRRIRPRTGVGTTWMAVDALGSAILGSTEAIESIDLARGRRTWMNVGFEAMDTQYGWYLDGHAIVLDRVSGLHRLDLESGTLDVAWPEGTLGEVGPRELRDLVLDRGRIAARFRERIVIYDQFGAIVGGDSIGDERRFRALVPAAEGYVLLNLRDSRQEPVQGRMVYRSVYRLYRLADDARIVGPMIELAPISAPIEFVALVDGHVLCDTAEGLLAISAPAE